MRKRQESQANRRGRLQQEAYRCLRELIIHEELVPGAKVSELELSNLTGFGRAPIRAALGQLAADGLVRIVPQSGVVVTEIDLGTQLKILEVRAQLERLLVKLAAERATRSQRRQIRELAKQMRQVTDRTNPLWVVKLLRNIHDTMLEAADNDILADVMDRIFVLSRRFWFAHREDYVGLRRSTALHAKRLRHIAEGRREEAAIACDELIAHLNEFVVKVLSEEPHAGDRSDSIAGLASGLDARKRARNARAGSADQAGRAR